MNELKTQFNKYFVYLSENHITSHVFIHEQCVDLGRIKMKTCGKQFILPRLFVTIMFRLMVENNVLYL